MSQVLGQLLSIRDTLMTGAAGAMIVGHTSHKGWRLYTRRRTPRRFSEIMTHPMEHRQNAKIWLHGRMDQRAWMLWQTTWGENGMETTFIDAGADRI